MENNTNWLIIEKRNPYYYWLDKNTFCLSFDGGIDEDGDEYSYLVEYHLDENKFVFAKWYEDDNILSDLTTDEQEYIKEQMLQKIKNKEDKE